MTTTRRRLHRTTFGLGQAQHRAALDVASVIKSWALQEVERGVVHAGMGSVANWRVLRFS